MKFVATLSTLSILALAQAAGAAPAQNAYSINQAKGDYARLLLAEGMMLTCHTGSPAEKHADELLYHPRIAAFEKRIRARFGAAIPATNRIKPDHDSCSSRKRYINEMERLLDQVEKRAAGFDAPAAAPATPAPGK